MELHEIRYLLAVHNAGSFTRAAEACHVTQPALTRAIQKLEEELGGQLLSRLRGNIQLTDLGQLLEPNFREMMSHSIDARVNSEKFHRNKASHLNIGLMRTIAHPRLVPFLHDFQAGHPRLSLKFYEGGSTRLENLLLSGEIDIGIITSPGATHSRLRTACLFSEHFVLACSQTHKLASYAEIFMQDLQDEVIIQRGDCESLSRIRQQLEASGACISDVYTNESGDWVQALIAAGFGIGLVPEYTNTRSDLARRPLVDLKLARQVCVVAASDRPAPPSAAYLFAALSKFDGFESNVFCVEQCPSKMEALNERLCEQRS